jgi:hypothetical protein
LWYTKPGDAIPFSTALATRRVGACLHFVYLCSYRHDFRRTHDLCSHAPGGQFRVHVKPLAVALTEGHSTSAASVRHQCQSGQRPCV